MCIVRFQSKNKHEGLNNIDYIELVHDTAVHLLKRLAPLFQFFSNIKAKPLQWLRDTY